MKPLGSVRLKKKAPKITGKKLEFHVAVGASHKLVVHLMGSQTVHDLIEACKATLRGNSNANGSVSFLEHSTPQSQTHIDVDALTTLYWVDAESLKHTPVHIVLRDTEVLRKVIASYKTSLATRHRLKNLRWFLGRRPSSELGLPSERALQSELHRVLWNIPLHSLCLRAFD